VVEYLLSLTQRPQEITTEQVIPIYEFLYQYRQRIIEEQSDKPIIFVPEPMPRFRTIREVFWDDERAVFGNTRDYLSLYYPEDLKPIFIGFGVRERAEPLDYVRALRDLAHSGEISKGIIRHAKQLQRKLSQHIDDNAAWIKSPEWEKLKSSPIWLGRKGNIWGFFKPDEMVYNDHSYIAGLFQGKLPFWDGDIIEGKSLLEILGVEPCSHAKEHLQVTGDKELRVCNK